MLALEANSGLQAGRLALAECLVRLPPAAAVCRLPAAWCTVVKQLTYAFNPLRHVVNKAVYVVVGQLLVTTAHLRVPLVRPQQGGLPAQAVGGAGGSGAGCGHGSGLRAPPVQPLGEQQGGLPGQECGGAGAGTAAVVGGGGWLSGGDGASGSGGSGGGGGSGGSGGGLAEAEAGPSSMPQVVPPPLSGWVPGCGGCGCISFSTRNCIATHYPMHLVS